MGLEKLKGKVRGTVNNAKFFVKKNSPEILLVTGVIGVVTGTILACRATLKAKEVIDEHKKSLDMIAEVSGNPENENKYTVEDKKKDLAIVYGKTAFKLSKLYAPVVILETASIAAIVGSHNILTKRNVALAAAYAGVEQSFKEYRKQVVDRFGETVDKELQYKLKSETVKMEEVTDDGEIVEVEKEVETSVLSQYGDYAIYFDKGYCTQAEGDDLHDGWFLGATEVSADDVLHADYFVVLNDVLDNLGYSKDLSDPEVARIRQAGMVVGWRYVEGGNPRGDNQVKFDIYKTHRTLPDGKVIPTMIVAFNTDKGNIYDHMLDVKGKKK